MPSHRPSAPDTSQRVAEALGEDCVRCRNRSASPTRPFWAASERRRVAVKSAALPSSANSPMTVTRAFKDSSMAKSASSGLAARTRRRFEGDSPKSSQPSP